MLRYKNYFGIAELINDQWIGRVIGVYLPDGTTKSVNPPIQFISKNYDDLLPAMQLAVDEYLKPID